MDADLLWIIIQTGADDAEAIWRQDTAMQLIGLVLLVLLIFLIRYLLNQSTVFRYVLLFMASLTTRSIWSFPHS